MIFKMILIKKQNMINNWKTLLIIYFKTFTFILIEIISNGQNSPNINPAKQGKIYFFLN